MNLFAHGKQSAEKHSFFLLKNFFKKFKKLLTLSFYRDTMYYVRNKKTKNKKQVKRGKRNVLEEERATTHIVR